MTAAAKTFVPCGMHVHPAGGPSEKTCGLPMGHRGACREVYVGPGVIGVQPCLDCGHTRCGFDCTCACNARRSA